MLSRMIAAALGLAAERKVGVSVHF